jgi:hypothetical protein
MPKSPRNSFLAEAGSVTAELAIALPSVALVIAITLGGFGLQVERMKLVDLSASGARALARGEELAVVEAMVMKARPDLALIVESEEDLVCLRLSFLARVPGLGSELLEVSERQCSRKMGL